MELICLAGMTLAVFCAQVTLWLVRDEEVWG